MAMGLGEAPGAEKSDGRCGVASLEERFFGPICGLTSNPRLRDGGTPPTMLLGARLLKWEPKKPPVVIIPMGIDTNVDTFICASRRELRAR